MAKLSRSPHRGDFQSSRYTKRKLENGEEPNPDYENLFKSIIKHKMEQEEDQEWQKDNMEYDMRTCGWMLEKVRKSESYAQNLYAAMCNNDFQKLEVMPILKDQTWSCSWRHSGGIIADMLEKGDYIDWYCSGIRGTGNGEDPYGDDPQFEIKKYVQEGVITDEIHADLEKLGWKAYDGDFKKFE